MVHILPCYTLDLLELVNLQLNCPFTSTPLADLQLSEVATDSNKAMKR